MHLACASVPMWQPGRGPLKNQSLNAMLKRPEFWRHMPHEPMLIIQTDALLSRPLIPFSPPTWEHHFCPDNTANTSRSARVAVAAFQNDTLSMLLTRCVSPPAWQRWPFDPPAQCDGGDHPERLSSPATELRRVLQPHGPGRSAPQNRPFSPPK